MTDSQVTANVSNIPVIIIMSYGENRWEGKKCYKNWKFVKPGLQYFLISND